MIYTKARLARFSELLDEVRQQHPEESPSEQVHRAQYRLNALHGHLGKRVLFLIAGAVALIAVVVAIIYA